MSTTTFHKDTSESSFMIIVMVMITISCLLYNSYHMFNWLYNMHYSPYSVWNIKANLMGMAGVSLAFLEIPAAVLLVNSIRLKDHILVTAMYFLFISLVCVMEVKAGMASQGSIYDQRNNAIASENKAIGSLATDLAAAQAKRDAAYALATTYKSAMQKTIRANADAKFLHTKATLEKENARMTRSKTTVINRDIYGNSTTDAFMIMLFPLFLSVGAVISTIYTLLHIKGKLRVAAMSMENKMQQHWNSDAIGNQANKLVVSPMTGVVSKIKDSFSEEQTTKPKINGIVITEKRGNATVKVAKLSDGTGLVEVFGHDNKGIEHIVFPTPDTRNFIKDNPQAEQTKRYYQALNQANRQYEKEQSSIEINTQKAAEKATTPTEIQAEDYPNVLHYKDFYSKDNSNKTSKPIVNKKPHDQPPATPSFKAEFPTPDSSRHPSQVASLLSPSTDTEVKKNPIKSATKNNTDTSTDLSDKATDKSVKIDKKVTTMIEKAAGVAPSTGVGTEVNCKHCGKAFTKNHYKQKFCSHTRKPRRDGGNCSDEYKNKMKLKQTRVQKKNQLSTLESKELPTVNPKSISG